MERGYLKLWRKSMDSEVFASESLWRLWCCCLMLANHGTRYVSIDGQTLPVKVGTGQFVTGRFTLHKTMYPRKRKNNPSPITVWRWLQSLEKRENLNIKTNNKFSIITIENWDSYQCKENSVEQQNEQQVNNRRTTDEQQVITNKNVKNEENVKNKEKKHSLCPHKNIISLYNEKLKSLTAVKENLWNGPRKTNLAARWKEDEERQCEEWWSSLFGVIAESPFLLGENDRGWKADLGWIVKRENLTKILEGKYNGMNGNGKGNKPISSSLSPRDQRNQFADRERKRIEEGVKNGSIDLGFGNGGTHQAKLSLPE